MRAANANEKCLELTWKGSRLNLHMLNSSDPVITGEMIRYQRELQTGFAAAPESAPHWLVTTSDCDSVFCNGTDHNFIAKCVDANDEEALEEYAHNCIDMLLDNLRGSGADVLTIGVIDGDAFNFGFEMAMSYDYLVATPRSRFAFPETENGLFPGMGAQMLLTRKIGTAAATKMIRDGHASHAPEMNDMGIVTHLCEPDEIEKTIESIIARDEPRRKSILAARKAMARACPMSEAEMRDIVDIWVENTMNVSQSRLVEMRRNGSFEKAVK